MGGSNSKNAHAHVDELEEGEQNFGSYKMYYFGSTTVSPPVDKTVVINATNSIIKSRHPQKKVIVNISTLGVEMFDAKSKSGATVAATPLKRITFISLIGKKRDKIAYIHKETESVLICHLLVSKKVGTNVINAVNEAFQASKELQRQARRQRQIAWDSNEGTTPEENNTETSTTTTADSSSSTPQKVDIPAPSGKLQEQRYRSDSVASVMSMVDSVDATFLDVPPSIFKCEYLGHTTVTQSAGEEVAYESAKTAEKSNKPCKAQFVISGQVLQIRRKKDGEPLQNSLVSELTFHTRGKKSTVLSFITKDREGITFCHTLRFKKKSQCTAALNAVGKAIVDLSNKEKLDGGIKPSNNAKAFARHLTSSSLQTKDPASLLGMFEAAYIGSVPIAEKRSQTACESATHSLLLSKPTPQAVAIGVSGEGVKIVEALTSELVLNMVIKNITFTTIITDKAILKKDKGSKKGEEALCVFVYHDQRLQRTSCEVFRGGRRAAQICEAVNVAFQVAFDSEKKKKNNPFAAVSKKRESVPGELFRRQIHRRDLAAISVLGMGQFGEVYLANHYVKPGKGENGSDHFKRACKMLRSAASVADRTEFLREAEVMLSLNHANLVRLIGVAVQQRPWLCVLEYMEYGDLKSVVKAAREKGMQFTNLEFMKLIVQIAKGMEYLSSLGFIHMDLAARNCLLSSHNLVKIADFGLTRKCTEGKDYYRLHATLKLPIKWMAIESMTEKIFSTKSDVWSFGITCWEIFSYGITPYPKMKNIDVQQFVRDGGRLSRPAACHNSIFTAILIPCWGTNWRERPSFLELRKRIIKFAKKARESSPSLRDVGHAIKIWDGKHQQDQDELLHAARLSVIPEDEPVENHKEEEEEEGNNNDDDDDDEEGIEDDIDAEEEDNGEGDAVEGEMNDAVQNKLVLNLREENDDGETRRLARRGTDVSVVDEVDFEPGTPPASTRVLSFSMETPKTNNSQSTSDMVDDLVDMVQAMQGDDNSNSGEDDDGDSVHNQVETSKIHRRPSVMLGEVAGESGDTEEDIHLMNGVLEKIPEGKEEQGPKKAGKGYLESALSEEEIKERALTISDWGSSMVRSEDAVALNSLLSYKPSKTVGRLVVSSSS